LRETRVAVDVARDPDEARDSRQLAEVGFETPQRVDHRDARVLAGVLEVDVAANLTGVHRSGVPVDRRVTRAVDDAADLHQRLVRAWRRDRWQSHRVTEFCQLTLWAHDYLHTSPRSPRRTGTRWATRPCVRTRHAGRTRPRHFRRHR